MTILLNGVELRPFGHQSADDEPVDDNLDIQSFEPMQDDKGEC